MWQASRHLADTPEGAGAEKRKQDCELKACGRLLGSIRRDFPQMGLCLTLDALYACGTAFRMAADHRCSFVCVFKEGSLPALWREFRTLLGMCPGNREIGGKRMSGRTRKANQYVRRAFCQAAWAASQAARITSGLLGKLACSTSPAVRA